LRRFAQVISACPAEIILPNAEIRAYNLRKECGD
jgi:hypothetical protein